MTAKCNGRIRDPKNPTIGPVERTVPRTRSTILQRYIYDDDRIAVRQSHRYGGWFGLTLSKSDVTRYVPLYPGGPVLLAGDDNTVDVQMTDRSGEPWFLYRAREGTYQRPLTWHENELIPTRRGAKIGVDESLFRNTGLLKPLNLPNSLFMDFQPWHVYALETDVLQGRRGRVGWNGEYTDLGLCLSPPPYSRSFAVPCRCRCTLRPPPYSRSFAFIRGSLSLPVSP